MFGKMDVLMRGADAVPVDDWSYMEYTFKPATYRNQQIADNTFGQSRDAMMVDRHLLTPATGTPHSRLRGLAPDRASFTEHPLAPHLLQDICPQRALMQ